MSKTELQQQQKPILPENIATIDQGKAFLSLLDLVSWRFHPDADALTAKFPEENSPSIVERRKLNKLMDQCIQISQENVFDPYAWYTFNNMEKPGH